MIWLATTQKAQLNFFFFFFDYLFNFSEEEDEERTPPKRKAKQVVNDRLYHMICHAWND